MMGSNKKVVWYGRTVHIFHLNMTIFSTIIQQKVIFGSVLIFSNPEQVGRHLKEFQCHTQAETILYLFQSKYDKKYIFLFKKKNSLKNSWYILYRLRRAYLRRQPINGLNSGDVNNTIYSPLVNYLQDNFLLIFDSSSFPLSHHISKLFGADDKCSFFPLVLRRWCFSLQVVCYVFIVLKHVQVGPRPHTGDFSMGFL